MKEVGILKDEIRRHFKRSTVAFLASAEGTQPRVRPVSLMYFEHIFWIATITSDTKVSQLRKNNKGYIRMTGTAHISRSKKERKMVARTIPFFKVFWRHPDDSSYTLLKIKVREIEYLRTGEFTAIRLPWKESDMENVRKRRNT